MKAETEPIALNFLELWWHHYGRFFVDPATQLHPGGCKYCGADGVVKPSDPVCLKHFSYTSKKPMEGEGNKRSIVQPGHALILSPDKAMYFTNLRRPPGCTADLQSNIGWGHFRANLLLNHDWPTPFILAEPTRRHGDLFGSVRPTYSYRRVWICGDQATAIDAVALREAVEILGRDFPVKHLFQLGRDRWTMARGAAAGDEYQKARARIREIHEKFPGTAQLFRFQKAWAIEPETATWAALLWALSSIQKQAKERAA